MRYTPEELLVYSKENKLMTALSEALRVNDRGYRLWKVEGIVKQTDANNFRFISVEEKDGKKVLDCDFENFPLERFTRTDHVMAYVAVFKDEVSLLDFIPAGADESATMELVYCHFLSKLGINTHGRLKKLFSDCIEIVDPYGFMN